jgi:hypothetical protein
MIRYSTVNTYGEKEAKRQAAYCSNEIAACAVRLSTPLKMLGTDDAGLEVFVWLQTLGSKYIFV